MDCMDCHNRPSHRFDSKPERAVNEAIALGRIPKTLPFVRREAVAALKTAYSSQEAAAAGIATRLSAFFDQQLGREAAARKTDIARAIAATQDIYRRNVFPSMKVVLGHLRQQHRAHGFRRVLPVPRRRQEDRRRPGDRAGLRTLPQDAARRARAAVRASGQQATCASFTYPADGRS